MITKKSLGILALFVLIHLPIFSQRLILNTTYLNSASGLSQNSIQCIFKDRYGFMWFGTQDGLNKYDGLKFTIYKHNINDRGSLPANLVNSINDDQDGNIWVGTRLGGLSKYNIASDSFVTYVHETKNAGSISDNNVNVIYRDKSANIWIGTSNGLNIYNSKTNSFIKYYSEPKDRESLTNSDIRSIYEDSDHNIWVGTSHGLNLFEKKLNKFIHFFDNNPGPNGNNNAINAIVEDETKNIWVGTGKGIDLIDKKNHTLIYYAIAPDGNLTGNINSIFSLKKTNNDRLWIGSNTTLQLFDARRRKIIPIDDKTNGESLMPNDGIFSLWEDNQGILWIGTTSEGIVKYDKNLTIFPSFQASISNPSAKNIIRGVAEDEFGNLYLATDIGIEYFDRHKSSYKLYQHSSTNINSLSSNYNLTLIVAKDRKVWISTYANGVDCLNPRTGKIKHFKAGQGQNEIHGGAIYALMEDKNGNIWIGAEGAGMQVLNPRTAIIERYLHNGKDPQSLCDNTIEAITGDNRGRIWLGGYSNGISVFDPATKKFRTFNSDNSGLSNNIISAFYGDGNGNMWIGTMEGGLNFYNRQTQRITSLSNQNGGLNNTINYISGDKYSNIWLSTINGISKYDPNSHLYKNYGYDNGLKSLEFNFGAGTTLKNGEIVFGNINGFNIINPDHLSFNVHKPKVVITGFELFNKILKPGNNSPLKKSITITKEIKLNYSQSIFSIDFAALSYTSPEKNTYAYQLEGFDSEWSYCTDQRRATYTNLNPGSYIFKVKAANNDGVWNNEPTKLMITIIPPFWMTWWFRLLCIFMAVMIAYITYFYRIAFFLRQKKELEKQVKLRTIEVVKQSETLLNLNEELQSQKEELQVQSEELQTQSKELFESSHKLQVMNKQLTEQKTQEENARLLAERAMKEAEKANQAKSAFLATMSHEIRTPMNGVLGMAALLSETPQNLEQQEYTNAIINSGESLLVVINDILDFSKIESGNLKLDPHEFDIRKCLDGVLDLFSIRTQEIGIKLSYHIDKEIPCTLIADGLRLRQILTNLIGNAVKFTHKGTVFVDVTKADAIDQFFSLNFEIRDTGIGIPDHQLGNLFQAFNQIDSSVSRKYGGTGLGLVICERLVHLMQGSIIVKSKEGIGSVFSFSVKCKYSTQSDIATPDDSALYKGKKILLIERDPTNLKILEAQLKKTSAIPISVSNFEEGYRLLQSQENLDLIIAGICYADDFDKEFVKRFKNDGLKAPIILIANDGNSAGYDKQFAHILKMPFSQGQLFKATNVALKKETVSPILKKNSLMSEQFALSYPFDILIAEDNLINQKLIVRILNKLGYDPDVANDGQEAIDMLAKKPYNLILMDMQMPNIDGLQATQKIRETYGSRPLISAMTANALTEDKENCLRAGMNEYISKPISIETLISKLVSLNAIINQH